MPEYIMQLGTNQQSVSHCTKNWLMHRQTRLTLNLTILWMVSQLLYVRLSIGIKLPFCHSLKSIKLDNVAWARLAVYSTTSAISSEYPRLATWSRLMVS